MKKVSLLLVHLFVFTCLSFSQTIKIGNQVWTSENLDVEKFRNGDKIPEAKTVEEMTAYSNAKEPAWCYYNFDRKNGKKYGKMYNGYAMLDPRKLAPEGWHIPSYDEFKLLIDFLGGEETARFKLKSKSGWANNKNGTNSSGFSGLPGGTSAGGEFFHIGSETDFYSTTPTSPEENGDVVFYYVMQLTYNDEKTYINHKDGTTTSFYISNKLLGSGGHIFNYFYIRCIKD